MARQHYGDSYGGSAAENYERYFVPTIGAPIATALLEVAALRPGERVLDVACGTGIVARLAAQQVGENGTVDGLDVNSQMLEVAAATAPGIQWHEASAEAMPFPDAAFDVVLCQMGLQFMTDKQAAIGEMHRVLTAGGRLILNVPGPTPHLFEIVEKSLASHISPEAAGFMNQVFSLNDAEKIAALVEGAGFCNVSVQADTKVLTLPEPAEFLWQYIHCTPLAAVVAQTDAENRDAFERDVVEAWSEFQHDGDLTLHVRVAVATGEKS